MKCAITKLNNIGGVKIKKKKGFTLVELLAVIVILAILVLLAVPSVLKMMNGSKDNAFRIESENIGQAAKTAYADDLLNGVTTRSVTGGYCYSISYLKTNGYIDKAFTASAKGSVLVGTSASTIWYTDGTRSVTGGTVGAVANDGTLQTVTTKFDTCNL